MNRSPIVERALCVLLPLLGFALVYGLPMLGLNFAIEHGLYVASAATIVPFLRGDRLERVVHVLDFLTHGTEQCATVVLEAVDGCPEMECCIPVAELHVEGVQTADTLSGDATEKTAPSHFPGSRKVMDIDQTDAHLFRDVAEVIGGVLETEYPLNSHVAGVDNLGGAA